MSGAVPSWARVGAKVVCIASDFFTRPEPGFEHPKVGEVFTIRETDVSPLGNFGFSLLERHPNDFYVANRFRPLVSQEDDIATHFAKHLHHTTPADLERV